jgi:signal transduction histidine kinase
MGMRERAAAAGWMRPLGILAVAVVLLLTIRGDPAPALAGEGLGVTIALVAVVASIVAVLRNPDGRWSSRIAPVAMIAASGALLWIQSSGSATVGMFVAVGYGALRLPRRHSLALLALAVLAVALAGAHAERSAGPVVGAELGIVAFYMLASFARSAQEAHEQTVGLLAELQASRSAQEQAAALQERGRIAREIHDVLAHSLSGLVLQLEGARMLAASSGADEELTATLERAHHLARAGLEEARRAIGTLRDEELPGPERLEQLTSEFARDTNIETGLEVSGTPRPLGPQASLTLYRIAQEALTNARAHARPERVALSLAYEPDGARLIVEDHGLPRAAPVAVVAGRDHRVAAPGAPRQGYGLTGMRERAELLGGSLQASPTNDGFRVELWIPG